MLHARHTPVQVLLQQRPSTQLVLRHCVPIVQLLPFGSGELQAPEPLQVAAPAHSLSGS
jgi:hypothetical protein